MCTLFQDVADLTGKLEELETQNQQLLRDLSDAQTNLQNQSVLHEVHRRSEVSLKQLQDEMRNRGETEACLKAECVDLRSRNQSLTAELQELRGDMEQKFKDVRQETSRVELEIVERERDQMEQERDLARLERDRMRQEWDSVKAELENAGSIVDDATSSLKFKLSSQSIELQQAKEVWSNICMYAAWSHMTHVELWVWPCELRTCGHVSCMWAVHGESHTHTCIWLLYVCEVTFLSSANVQKGPDNFRTSQPAQQRAESAGGHVRALPGYRAAAGGGQSGAEGHREYPAQQPGRDELSARAAHRGERSKVEG